MASRILGHALRRILLSMPCSSQPTARKQSSTVDLKRLGFEKKTTTKPLPPQTVERGCWKKVGG